MKKLALLLCCLVLGLGSGWAGTGLITSPGAITQDYYDWCVQFGCLNNYQQFATPQPIISQTYDVTGTVGLNGGFQSFYNLQEGVTWNGQFANNQGILYNGRLFGNQDAGFVLTFDTGVYAAGTYIQSDYYGPFTAFVTIFDINSQVIASYSALGNSGFGPGTALFIGAYDSVPFYAVQFDVLDQFGLNDVAIGTTWINTTPEPSSLLLFGSSALGLAGVLRRRFKGVL
jgi:PEP-CTERM motif-containing protein